jgi:hypothetical protein
MIPESYYNPETSSMVVIVPEQLAKSPGFQWIFVVMIDRRPKPTPSPAPTPAPPPPPESTPDPGSGSMLIPLVGIILGVVLVIMIVLLYILNKSRAPPRKSAAGSESSIPVAYAVKDGDSSMRQGSAIQGMFVHAGYDMRNNLHSNSSGRSVHCKYQHKIV